MKDFDASMKASSASFDRSEMFTRRTATVIISVPDASCAWIMTAGDEYLPVPTNSRDVNVFPAIVRRSALAISPLPSALVLPATHKVHDLDLVAFAHHRRAERVAFQDGEIV